MNSPIVLIHGLWLTPLSWEGWKARFEQQGHEVLAPAQIRTVFPALRNPANRKKTVPLTPEQFRFRFTNTMNDTDAEAAYQRYYVPGPGRVLFQAGFANFNPHAVTKVDVHKDDRPPLLVLGNERDHTVPASVSREAAKRLGKSKARSVTYTPTSRPHCPRPLCACHTSRPACTAPCRARSPRYCSPPASARRTG